MVELPKLSMNFGNLLMTDFGTGNGDAASHHSRVCDGGDHLSCSIADAARPVLNSN